MLTGAEVFVLLALGWFGGWHVHKWRYAESDLRSAQNRITAATRAAWRARGWLVLAAIVLWGMWYHWKAGGGHG